MSCDVFFFFASHFSAHVAQHECEGLKPLGMQLHQALVLPHTDRRLETASGDQGFVAQGPRIRSATLINHPREDDGAVRF